MRRTFLIISLFISVASFAQGNVVKQDTAAQRKEQEAYENFKKELLAKTSIEEFAKWLYENASGKVNADVSRALSVPLSYFIQQKFIASKQGK